MNKPIKVATGVIQHGQLRLNIARDGGKPKNVGAVPISHGMKRVTADALHPYLHSQAVDDETAIKLSQNGRSVPIHDGMGTSAKHAHQRGIVAHVEDASKHLAAAAQLGRADRVDPSFDITHVGHRISRNASLPASKRKLSE